jgi:hypothetical protein
MLRTSGATRRQLSATFATPMRSFGAVARTFTLAPGPVMWVNTTCAAKRFHRPASYSEIREALNTLKVDINVKDAPLKKAYLDLVRANHPDMGGSEAKMKEITTSYNLLKGLSESDRKGFKTSNNYGPGMGGSSHTERSRTPQYNNPHDAHDAYRRKYEQAPPRGFYRYDAQSGNYENAYRGRSNPFEHGPFPNAMKDIRGTPFPILFFRALLAYTAFSFLFLVMYRSYKDYTHDDGWAASQAAWRNERIETLQQIRSEARDRAREREREHLERRRTDTSASREQRAMDYARRREHEMTSADHGAFPRLNPEGLEGLIMRDYNDPVGIAYYVPPLTNGAPPFSGNGRFQYSTGSIPRSQCIPTIRQMPAAHTPDVSSNFRATGGPRGGATLANLSSEAYHHQHQESKPGERVFARAPADTLPVPSTSRTDPLREEPSTAPAPGFYGSHTSNEPNDQPLNMRRRAYVPRGGPSQGTRAEAADSVGNDTTRKLPSYAPDGMIAMTPTKATS